MPSPTWDPCPTPAHGPRPHFSPARGHWSLPQWPCSSADLLQLCQRPVLSLGRCQRSGTGAVPGSHPLTQPALLPHGEVPLSPGGCRLAGTMPNHLAPFRAQVQNMKHHISIVETGDPVKKKGQIKVKSLREVRARQCIFWQNLERL